MSLLKTVVPFLTNQADVIVSCELHMAIPLMDLSKIFDKTIGGECNSILLHFCKLWQHVFFLFQGLDVRASDYLSDRFFNWISCNKGLKAKIRGFSYVFPV